MAKFKGGKVFNKDISIYNSVLYLNGASETINSQAVFVDERDSAGDVLRAHGTVAVTDAGSGYAKGAIYIKTDVADGTSGFYENVGTNTSCNFDLIGSGGAATLYSAIGDPDANGSIAMAAYTGTYTSSTANWGGLISENSHSNPTSGATLLSLKYTADGDADGIFLKAIDNAVDTKFQIAANGATTIAGSATGTAALTLTAGDITLTSGDVDIAADNRRISFGASGDTDSYILFDGTNLTFYDAVSGSATLAQLISASPTGDFTISNGQFSWTDSTDEQGGTWTFSNTTSNDIAWVSAVTAGKALSIVADSLISGAMIYLESSATGLTTGDYIRCYDGAANDFEVGANGATIIAGVASTDVLTVSAGDIQITAGDIDIDLGIITIDNTADEGNTIKRNNATGTVPVLEIEETHATGGINLLLDTKNTTAAEYNLDMTSSGATHMHMTANGAAGDYVLVDVTNAHTGQVFKIDAGPWLGTAGEGAALDFRSDSAATAEAGHAIYIKMQGTSADAAAIEGKGLYIEDEGATQAGSYLVALDSLANGALLVKAGVSTFKGNVTLGVDATGVDFKAFGDTTAKFMVWDQSADDLILADAVALQLGGDESTADGFKFEFDGTATCEIYALTANDSLVIGSTTDTDFVVHTTAGAALTVDSSANSAVLASTVYLKATGSGTGKGLMIPAHATASPSAQDEAGAGNIFFEVDANKLRVYNGTGWVGTVLA